MSDYSPNIEDFENVYLIGIGGIGMSALARYFDSKGKRVGGYDKTETELTNVLAQQGISIHYDDLGTLPEPFNNIGETLVIYTPAVPHEMGELKFARNNSFVLKKRSEVLGMITRSSIAIAVAGTHGKTTTSTLMAHILNVSSKKCNAFLGGISTNYNSNFLSSDSELTVVEADEFDRSFLHLSPFASIITSTDADHLDIYGNKDDLLEGFKQYVKRIDENGWLIKHHSVEITRPDAITYGLDSSADYFGSNLRYEDGHFLFNVTTPTDNWNDVELGIPGIHNAENALACIAMAEKLGLNKSTILAGLKTFEGVKRRFEYHVKKDKFAYIDDYAHHPTEIDALIASVRLLYPQQRITGVFQPHLFSRTRDFFGGFTDSLSRLDEVILLPIYPAREKPIEGITSDQLCQKIILSSKQVLEPMEVVKYLKDRKEGIILTIGAGDIDRIVEPLAKALSDQ